MRAAERDSRRRQRELERRQLAVAKEDALERAALAYETYENLLERLVSVHQEGSDRVDWVAVARAKEPTRPIASTRDSSAAESKLAAYVPGFFARLFGRVESQRSELAEAIALARAKEDGEYRAALAAYETQKSDWAQQKDLAERVLGGEPQGFMDALAALNPFTEIGELGSNIRFAVKEGDVGTIRVDVEVHSATLIPKVKFSLLKSGKLSTKEMPTAERNRVYQDHVCSVTLRVARELFALLPVDTVYVTASDQLLDTATGLLALQPIVSVQVPRQTFEVLNLSAIDPSDSMRNFACHMDFSPKVGFRPVARIDSGKQDSS